MPKIVLSSKLLLQLFVACNVIYLASQSYFVGIFLVVAIALYFKKSISKSKSDAAANEAKTASASVAQNPPAAVQPQPEPVQASITPKRQYAKSAVVIPFKTGTDD